MPRAWTVTDLLFGDSGKGTLTEALVRRYKVPLVVRYSGGPQCGHNVVLENGTHHVFSQFGAGTLAGARTLLTKHVLIDPVRLINEGDVLEKKGVSDPFGRVMIDTQCLVITPFHRAVNRLKELSRGAARHGSCGVGVGETAAYALKHPDTALRVEDLLFHRKTREKLEQISKDCGEEIVQFCGGAMPPEGAAEWGVFTSPDTIDAYLNRYRTFCESGVIFVSTKTALNRIRTQDTVWEGAQGVLLDEWVGFHPFTTWSTVTLQHAIEHLALAGVSRDDITNIGVLRCYGHRHGAGPFPTENESLRPILDDKYNPENLWQGQFRVGWFDAVMADYGKRVAGPIDQLALTHIDRLASRDKWLLATGYPGGEILPPHPEDFTAREHLTNDLMKLRSDDLTVENVVSSRVPAIISDYLDLPVTVTSSGPTYADKQFSQTLVESISA
jgi:adenylosuccinate synthase